MDALKITQSKLDKVLLPFAITSHHLRRVNAEYIEQTNGQKVKVNDNEYVVYRLVSTRQIYDNGMPTAERVYVDVNYYYSYEKTDSRFAEVRQRINAIVNEFLSDGRIRLANGESDIYDLDNPFRGINVEFLFMGAVDYGG